MYVCTYVCMCVCIYVCYICMYICMYVCYICMYICTRCGNKETGLLLLLISGHVDDEEEGRALPVDFPLPSHKGSFTRIS